MSVYLALSDVIRRFSETRAIPVDKIAVIYEGESDDSTYRDYKALVDVYDDHIVDLWHIEDMRARYVSTAIYNVPTTWGDIYAGIIKDILDGWNIAARSFCDAEKCLRESVVLAYEKAFHDGIHSSDFSLSEKTAHGTVGKMNFYLTDSRHIVFFGNPFFPEKVIELEEVY